MKLNPKDITILIPARLGSKGLPGKNRKLLNHTLSTIPKEFLKNTWISTDDPVIKKECASYGINVHDRRAANATDTASTKKLVQEFVYTQKISNTIVMLYLTYPERTWDDIKKGYDFYKKHKGTSMLCRKEVKQHPYLMMKDKGIFGEQLIKHNLYRRQDYPQVFEISHFIAIFEPWKFQELNNNMYNEQTVFYPIKAAVDVDTQNDLDDFNSAKLNKKPESVKNDYKTMKEILICGNDNSLPQILDKDISKYTTIGINRSWHVLETDYLFFHDIDILVELHNAKKDIKKMNLVSSDYLYSTIKNTEHKHIFNMYKNHIKIYKRKNVKMFPDSVTYAIHIFNECIFNDHTNIFNLYAVSMFFNAKKNHFWSGEKDIILNDKDTDSNWYTSRFTLMVKNIRLLSKHINIVSSTKESALNGFLVYKEL